VAKLAGKISLGIFAANIAAVARWYNDAPVLVEENNHGHAIILWLTENAPDVFLLDGRRGRAGWQTDSLSKSLLYDLAAEKLRKRECAITDFGTKMQLASIEAGTLAAPEPLHDDAATSFVLALMAVDCRPRGVLDVWT
jgi:hypothetical protein